MTVDNLTNQLGAYGKALSNKVAESTTQEAFVIDMIKKNTDHLKQVK